MKVTEKSLPSPRALDHVLMSDLAMTRALIVHLERGTVPHGQTKIDEQKVLLYDHEGDETMPVC